jgi:plastocyanin
MAYHDPSSGRTGRGDHDEKSAEMRRAPTGGYRLRLGPRNRNHGQRHGRVAESKAIKINDGSFEPPDMSVKVGTTVKWTNDGKKPHTVTSDKGDWGSGELAEGQTFTATFTKAGTFEYHCKLHPDMKAKITVK